MAKDIQAAMAQREKRLERERLRVEQLEADRAGQTGFKHQFTDAEKRRIEKKRQAVAARLFAPG